MAADDPVRGTVAPGFEPVRDAFAENFRSRRELGAACALAHEGRLVVDLWGGVRDRRTGGPWEKDTLVLVFSVSKGVAATALAILHARGRLDYDAPVATYWPEFAQAGKADITVRSLLAHQAGLAAIDRRLDPDRIGDPERLDALLARQTPRWRAGARHAYHAISLGFYQAALLRRIDPSGRSMGTFVREELGSGLTIGVPPDVPRKRTAHIAPLPTWRVVFHARSISPRLALALAWPLSLTARSVRNPHLGSPAALDAQVWRERELPSSNGYATARALATMYGSLATDGRCVGVGEPTLHELRAAPRPPTEGDWDGVFKRRTAFLLGYMKPSAGFRFGRSDAAFGAPGVGGSFAYADPDRRCGYAYVTNRLGYTVFDDPREQALRRACEECLDTA